MRYLFIILYFILFQAHSHQFEKNNIIIKHPVLKIVSTSTKIGAGYFKIINNSEKEIYLVGVTSRIAKKQEVHEVIEENNVFKMRPLKKSLLIKPGTEIEFKPQSYHLMFFELNEIFKTDQMLKAKLNFNKDFFIPVEFKVVINSSNHDHH